MKLLHIFRGVPGSGKSTAAAREVDEAKALSLSVSGPFEADTYMVDADGKYAFNPKKLGFAHRRCQEDVRHAMFRGIEVVVTSNTNITFKEMQPYLDMAEEFGYEVQITVIESNFKSIHGVPDETIADMKRRFQYVRPI